jgi:hypothetical protein
MGSFDGAWIVLAVAVQAAALIVIGARHRIPVVAAIGHVMAGVTGLGWVTLVTMGADARWGAEDVVSGLVLLITLGVAWLIQDTTRMESSLAPVYAGLTLPGMLVWSLAILGPLPQGAGLVTAVWASTGFGMLIWGRLGEHHLVRNLGIGVVLLAVAKLLVVDTASAGAITRIVLSGSIGLALLLVGYWLATDEDGTVTTDGGDASTIEIEHTPS